MNKFDNENSALVLSRLAFRRAQLAMLLSLFIAGMILVCLAFFYLVQPKQKDCWTDGCLSGEVRGVGGTTFQDLGQRTAFLDVIKEELSLKSLERAITTAKIAQQISEAKENAEQVLSQAEIDAIRDRAQSVLARAREFVERMQEQQTQLDAGSMVFCSSMVIE